MNEHPQPHPLPLLNAHSFSSTELLWFLPRAPQPSPACLRCPSCLPSRCPAVLSVSTTLGVTLQGSPSVRLPSGLAPVCVTAHRIVVLLSTYASVTLWRTETVPDSSPYPQPPHSPRHSISHSVQYFKSIQFLKSAVCSVMAKDDGRRGRGRVSVLPTR